MLPGVDAWGATGPARSDMRDIRREALVPYSAARMFALIERVEDYPQFLPWCLATQLIDRTETTVSATVEVGLRDLRVRVTTRNEKRAPEFMAVHMEGGSFRQFYGEWMLRPLGDSGCHIFFRLQFELALRADALAGRLIEHAADRIVDAFVQRAEAMFGSASPVNAPSPESTLDGLMR
jgi:ribosome-associated toxin RatA of RatAB toxin-antitoxin module